MNESTEVSAQAEQMTTSRAELKYLSANVYAEARNRLVQMVVFLKLQTGQIMDEYLY